MTEPNDLQPPPLPDGPGDLFEDPATPTDPPYRMEVRVQFEGELIAASRFYDQRSSALVVLANLNEIAGAVRDRIRLSRCPIDGEPLAEVLRVEGRPTELVHRDGTRHLDATASLVEKPSVDAEPFHTAHGYLQRTIAQLGRNRFIQLPEPISEDEFGKVWRTGNVAYEAALVNGLPYVRSSHDPNRNLLPAAEAEAQALATLAAVAEARRLHVQVGNPTTPGEVTKDEGSGSVVTAGRTLTRCSEFVGGSDPDDQCELPAGHSQDHYSAFESRANQTADRDEFER